MRVRSTASASGAGSLWAHVESFTPVEGQTDYEFTGFSGANLDAGQALVSIGIDVWEPDTDYTILTDRIRLTSAPDATLAASGLNIVVRVRLA